jgi:hypothetical protein
MTSSPVGVVEFYNEYNPMAGGCLSDHHPHHPPKMIRPMHFHQVFGDPFRPFLFIEFLDGENKAVVVAVVKAKNLKSGAVLVGMGKNDGGHGGGSVAAFRITQPGEDGEGSPPLGASPYITFALLGIFAPFW